MDDAGWKGLEEALTGDPRLKISPETSSQTA
jgi:hypothetical protein